jgi:hypothetical protein
MPRKSTGMTYDSEESFTKRYFAADENSGGSLGSLGNALSEAIRFQEVRSRLQQMLNAGNSDEAITETLRLTPDELMAFRGRLKAAGARKPPEATQAPDALVTALRSREIALEEFLGDPHTEIDIVPWSSYYRVLKFAAKELAEVRHVKDQSLGILIHPDDLHRLVRLAFSRMYSKEVLKYVREKKLSPIALVTDKTDLRSQRVTGSRVRMRHIVIREELFRRRM